MSTEFSSSSEEVAIELSDVAEAMTRPGFVWLDSSQTKASWGRRSLLASEPAGEIILQDGRTTVKHNGHVEATGDARLLLESLDDIYRSKEQTAVGFISYEASLPWLGVTPHGSSDNPEAHFFVYDHVDWIEKLGARQVVTLSPSSSPQPRDQVSVVATIDRDSYVERVKRIKWHIREGDIYQANLTCRFDVRSNLIPVDVYSRLRELNPVPYGAYLNFGDYAVLSSSPERLFLLDDRTVSASPVKGTIARLPDVPDEIQGRTLLASEKDRAELLMITDLVRNDLGRVAAIGSVRVDNLYRLDVCSSVIHLVSDIEAELAESASLSDLLLSMLPGGSITGAPKKRAVEILNELEPVARWVYTGCIGYVAPGRADFNVAIRTLTYKDGVYTVSAGGGIVADSDPESEYREMRLKASNLFKAVGAESWAPID